MSLRGWTPLQVDAVVLLRDLDDQPERREGLEQAREEFGQIEPTLRVVIGAATPEREAWLVAGFHPETPAEEQRLAVCRRDLGFDPVTSSHLLTSKRESQPKDAKRVLGVLTAGDGERTERCYKEPALAVLTRRGQENGFARFVAEIGERLVPHFTGHQI